jgi:hypothetical protein
MGLIFIFLVFHAAGAFIWLLPTLYFVVLASLILSGGEYLLQGFRILRNHKSN